MQFGKKPPPSDLNRHRVVKSDKSAPNAFSYHTNRSERNTSGQGRVPTINMDRSANDRSVSKAKSLLVVGLLILVLILVIIASWVSSNADIKIVQPDGFNYSIHNLNQYRQDAAKAINSSFFNHFKMTLNTTQINTSIESGHPEIEYASISAPLIGSKPTVYIQLQRPILIYNNSLGSYVVDANGVIIAQSSSFSTNQLSAFNSVDSSINNQLRPGQQVLTQQNVSFIETVAQALKIKNIPVSKMVLTPAAAELDVYIQGQPYFVKFNIYQTDALQQVGTYLATLATLKQQGKTPTQYIDVRVDGRAYYK